MWEALEMPRFALHSTELVPERALLVGVELPGADWALEDSLAELARLVETDGAEVAGTLTQRLPSPVPRTFIGKGKCDELVSLVNSLEIDVVVFDDELTPSQQSNLERIVKEPVKVIDRTALILDIFGQHAVTHEGRIQVQLAQLQYVLPRLRGMWSHLVGEQTRGGIGSRFGQGESQLEVDRRLIRSRITHLRRELKQLETRREQQGKARQVSGIFRVALVGYTNAGKSTLLNRLTGAAVLAHDQLFATLDPTTRALTLEEGRRVTLTDTVGFIQKLPTTLVEAFKSTLAEVRDAHLLLHIVDASDVHAELEIEATREVLGEVLGEAGAGEKRTILVFNKSDLLDEEERRALQMRYPEALLISAEEGFGLAGLIHAISQEASREELAMTVLIPYAQGALVQKMHERCRVISERYTEAGTEATIRVSADFSALFRPYQVNDDAETLTTVMRSQRASEELRKRNS